MAITFKPLNKSHFPLLLKWLESPHVKKSWDQDVTYTIELVKEKYSSYVKGYKLEGGVQKPIQAFIIYSDQNPVGYIQIYNAYDFPRSKPLLGLPSNLGAFDIFIGEAAALQQELGSKAILEFLRLHGNQYSYIFADPDSNNLSAIKCYEKAGFKMISEPQDTGEVWMLKSIDIIESSIVDELIANHNCTSIILYGSRARGDYNINSDYDIFGITKDDKEKRIARFEEKFQVYYDIFLYPSGNLYPIKAENLKLKDGFCIYDAEGVGSSFLDAIKEEWSKTNTISQNDSEAIKVWHSKMADRASVNDLEGKYRKIWLIYALLEDYFVLRDIRYEGPKIAFKYLKQHDIMAYELFEALLAEYENEEFLNNLITCVAGRPIQHTKFHIVDENKILDELKSREPIFHHPEKLGQTKQDIENQMCDEFWEVGASGNVYTKQDVIETLLERYNDPSYQDIWEAKDFALTKIAPDNYLLTYILIQEKTRVTRRSTLWRHLHGDWKILYHQGTIVDGGSV